MISTSALPVGLAGMPYSFQLQAEGAPQNALTWHCDNDLPQGIGLDSASGILSGANPKSCLPTSLTFWVESSATKEKSPLKVLSLCIGPCWSSALFRECLGDSGASPRPGGYPFASPDIICTQDKAIDPSTLAGNYGCDPNLPLLPGRKNFLYLRAKNLGSVAGAGDAFLYYCPSSLLPLPSQWAANAIGPSGSLFDQCGAGSISVADTPFLWLPPQSLEGHNYTLVCATSTAGHPWRVSDIPSFTDWLSFSEWVSGRLNLALRTVTVMDDLSRPTCTRFDLLSYPFFAPTPMLLRVEASGVPAGAQVLIRSDALGLNTRVALSAPSQPVYSDGATCPAGFRGDIETTVQLPGGQSWQNGSQITTTLFFGYVPVTPPSFAGGSPGGDASTFARTFSDAVREGKLVAVGSCMTLFKAATR